VCTTIIETGVDVPNANTLIIENANNLGLAQLHQIRGRVGRSARRGFAYLTFNRNKELTEIATKRLTAIREYTEFGSGFKIAMRDLEIRGAGNLLGAEQHGHMEAVGYDMYCRMLNEAVRNLKGSTSIPDFATVVDLDVDAFIPPAYIVNESQKLDIYKRIAGIENEKERDDMKDELLDRFGDIPDSVDNLLRIALIRVSAHKLYLTEVKGKNERLTLTFRPDAQVDPLGIPPLLKKYGDSLKFTAYGNPFFTYRYKKSGLVQKDAAMLLTLTEELLREMTKVLRLPEETV
jgi:transcription-repair coupling factor (superfamily II helicase)